MVIVIGVGNNIKAPRKSIIGRDTVTYVVCLIMLSSGLRGLIERLIGILAHRYTIKSKTVSSFRQSQ